MHQINLFACFLHDLSFTASFHCTCSHNTQTGDLKHSICEAKKDKSAEYHTVHRRHHPCFFFFLNTEEDDDFNPDDYSAEEDDDDTIAAEELLESALRENNPNEIDDLKAVCLFVCVWCVCMCV